MEGHGAPYLWPKIRGFSWGYFTLLTSPGGVDDFEPFCAAADLRSCHWDIAFFVPADFPRGVVQPPCFHAKRLSSSRDKPGIFLKKHMVVEFQFLLLKKNATQSEFC